MFPLFSRELATAMSEEAKRLIGDLVWNDKDFTKVFTANYSFINSDLAAVYKVSPPARDFDRVEFPVTDERAGILGQTLFLTLTSKPEGTAPTGRGLFVREQFLCQHVPPPPPGVDTNLPPVTESQPVTNRQRMAMHGPTRCAPAVTTSSIRSASLDLYHTTVSKKAYEGLRAAIPQCQIFFDEDSGLPTRRGGEGF